MPTKHENQTAVVLVLVATAGHALGCSEEVPTRLLNDDRNASAAGQSAGGEGLGGALSNAAGQASAGQDAEAGTGGESGAAGAPAELPCVGPPGGICDPFPLIGVAFAFSDECSGPQDCPTLTLREPGTLCMAGGPPLVNARPRFALLMYGDPTLLGVEQIEFSIESAPPAPGGVIVRAARPIRQDPSCAANPPSCSDFGFELPPITEDGPVVARWSDFVQQDPESPVQTFTSDIFIALEIAVYEGAYDFCLSDLKFIDGEGNQILHPRGALK